MHILQNLLIKIYLIVLTFQNTSNNNYAVTEGIECKGSKSFYFYCDDVATEREREVVKNVNVKQTTLIYFYTQRLLKYIYLIILISINYILYVLIILF